jgi:hypothetical protein
MGLLKRAFVLTIATLALTACYRSPHQGWSCKAFGPDPCTPNEGRWHGLKIGMNYPDALRAVCKMALAGDIRPNDPKRPIYGYNPVDVVGSSCRPKPEFEDATFLERARTMGTSLVWGVHPSDMWCLTTHAVGNWVANWDVVVEFDQKLRIKAIRGDCPAWASVF